MNMFSANIFRMHFVKYSKYAFTMFQYIQRSICYTCSELIQPRSRLTEGERNLSHTHNQIVHAEGFCDNLFDCQHLHTFMYDNLVKSLQLQFIKLCVSRAFALKMNFTFSDFKPHKITQFSSIVYVCRMIQLRWLLSFVR